MRDGTGFSHGSPLNRVGIGVGGVTPRFQTSHLPPQVTEVPKDRVRAFSHHKKVGAYLLGKSIGEGSFAKVKEALHLPTGEKVAIKVIDKKRAKADCYVRKNLRREGRLLQQIRHSHVVQLLEVLETEHCYYLAMEFCSGGDLMDHIGKHKRLEESEVKKFIRQIVSAVDYLHRLGIIHRDLKIENLLLDENKDIKLIDFGLSNTIKVNSARQGVAHAQEFLVTQCGSPAYAAPELLDHRKYGLQVDVWSIGINMYAMLTGNLPFTVDPFSIKGLHNKMVNGQMNPMPQGLSTEGKDILKKFLKPDPDQRLTIADALRHPWLTEGRNKPVERSPFPNKLKAGDLEPDILKHMSDNLGFRMSEVIRYVVGNTPSSACATYHLFRRKLQRHQVEENIRNEGRTSVSESATINTVGESGRISLILRSLMPRSTRQHTLPAPLPRPGNIIEAEPATSLELGSPDNSQRKSCDKGKTVAKAPCLAKNNTVGKERNFPISLHHGLEDGRANGTENKGPRRTQLALKPGFAHKPKVDNLSPRYLPPTARTSLKIGVPPPPVAELIHRTARQVGLTHDPKPRPGLPGKKPPGVTPTTLPPAGWPKLSNKTGGLAPLTRVSLPLKQDQLQPKGKRFMETSRKESPLPAAVHTSLRHQHEPPPETDIVREFRNTCSDTPTSDSGQQSMSRKSLSDSANTKSLDSTKNHLMPIRAMPAQLISPRMGQEDKKRYEGQGGIASVSPAKAERTAALKPDKNGQRNQTCHTPVSPQPTPAAQRYLSKRVRADALLQATETTADTRTKQRADDETEDVVPLDGLVTSPEGIPVTGAAIVDSQSPRHDLYSLPAI